MAATSEATRNASVALDFFIGNLVNGNDCDCPASGLRSRQLLFLLRSNQIMSCFQNILIIPQCSEDRTFTRL
jgi:hypothetical protein